ncbi:UNVERIFIED_CONTAM: hypothetical protein GTU68_025295 [Idotea baltica]|nr:hypothetical protein [Idotea baltica]
MKKLLDYILKSWEFS